MRKKAYFYIFLGIPGAGKSTQINLLKDHFRKTESKLVEINIGESLRNFLKNSPNPLIKSMCSDINKGSLAPSVMPIFLWTKKILKEYEPGCIFFLDGGVRKEMESDLFLDLLCGMGDNIQVKVIYLITSAKNAKKQKPFSSTQKKQRAGLVFFCATSPTTTVKAASVKHSAYLTPQSTETMSPDFKILLLFGTP